MKKSLCIETIFTEDPFLKRFGLARESGFDYIEFWTWKDKDVAKIKELCEENQLKVAIFSGDQDFSLIDENEGSAYIEFAKQSIETARYLSCEYLVLHSNALGEGGVVRNHYNEVSNYKKFGNMLNVLKALAPVAEKARVTLVLEALNTKIDHVGNFLAFTRDAIEVVELVNSPCLKILYDIYHMQIMEGDIVNTLIKYLNDIGYIHIADVPGRQEPGTGEINYANVMCALEQLKYDKFIGFELFPSGNSKEAAEIIKAL